MTKFWILGTSVSKGQGSKVSKEAFLKNDTFQADWIECLGKEGGDTSRQTPECGA